MKHFFQRTATAAVIVTLLLSVCSSAKRAYDFSKENPKASVWLLADDNAPKSQKRS
ncbi:MAG: hypothetical protein K2G16_04510 [Lachnospiraceae bacterium]|nr:hypothetical protein [Lachnospiraceae bacterium]